MAFVIDVQFEHYHFPDTLGVHETRPRLSWKISRPSDGFAQVGYEVEIQSQELGSKSPSVHREEVVSPQSILVPWPFEEDLTSRQNVSVRIRAWDAKGQKTPWSDPAGLEIGLNDRSDWRCDRIAAPWAPNTTQADPEQLFRKAFWLDKSVNQARLYITAQGVYEAEINGQKIGDHFLAPGWTAYAGRLQYQTYDITRNLAVGNNCIGVRVAEGWFSGRIGFGGGHRNIWGPHTSLLVQLEVNFTDGGSALIGTDGSWTVTKGPIQLAEIYDGEKYDARLEVPDWSTATGEEVDSELWKPVLRLSPLPDSTQLIPGYGGAVRRIEDLKPLHRLTTPSGKTIIDFGQNLVGYVKLKHLKGPRGHKITLSHAEVLEHEELCTRPLRICKAVDEYTLKGAQDGEEYEPRFTFHGFRYAQIENWPGELNLDSISAVVCHTDMKKAGAFSCSEPLLNKLHQNIVWGMRGNFLSVPTDCPQRDERMGWSGDLALFAPTAVLLYDCFGMLKNWLLDVEYDQGVLGGVPPMVSPNATLPDPVWCRRVPCAIWHDVTILGPWALYLESGDESILARQFQSMKTWMEVLPRDKNGSAHLWDPVVFQLGDWLDPAAPPDAPWKSPTDSKMVANMFLIQSLDLMGKISSILGKGGEQAMYEAEAQAARTQFHEEYVTSNGRLVSDTQAAYALAICLDLLTPEQRVRAGNRLVELVRKNEFRIATGFAGTPFLCEALAATGHIQVAYSMLLEKECPSWLYPVTMGATTVWERWDSMLPDGTVNPGKMTSFNHYAFGAIAKFLHERLAGLQRLGPGWRECRIQPAIGAAFSHASAEHVTRHGTISCSWKTERIGDGMERMELSVSVPYGVTAEVVVPEGEAERRQQVGHGVWSFQTDFKRDGGWPVSPLKGKY